MLMLLIVEFVFTVRLVIWPVEQTVSEVCALQIYLPFLAKAFKYGLGKEF